MQGSFLRFYTAENRRHRRKLVYEWLLEEARSFGLHGGSAFRAMAGFGRHGRLHEDRFFELAGELPVEVGFVVTDDEADRFLAHIEAQGLSLFYMRAPVTFGFTGSQAA